ncbi:uncharacterized protein LOC122499618 [Leptopilina heterotoma]|uniref:uncharacterized protein LOC122499618 n=1 Tax=Leptopilina heterotoma TaxID=63436 RepID=UPI001CA81670|nr:uncharacterized protein LOC122499618 [Leptopilina heterotoma]
MNLIFSIAEKMDEDKEDGKRKTYRKFIRPNYKPSMVSAQTDAIWRQRAIALERSTQSTSNRIVVQRESSDDLHESDLQSASSTSSNEMSIGENSTNDVPRDEEMRMETNQDFDQELNEDSAPGSNAPSEGSGSEDSDIEFLDNEVNGNENPNYTYPWENRIMFPQSNLTVRDVVAMTRGFSLRFGLSLEARLELTNLLKLCAGPEFDSLNLSNYKMTRMFEAPEKTLTFSFYCPACKKVLISQQNKKSQVNPEGLCDKCGSRCNLSTKKGKYMLMVDLKYQIEQLFKLRDVQTFLIDRYRQNPENDGSIRDVQDGSLYKSNNPTNSKNVLTLNVFFDGAIMKRSGNESFWAILASINELPISLRFKYIMLGGIMMVDKEPDPDLMNSFSEEFLNVIDILRTQGVDLLVGNLRINFLINLLFIVVDSVARPILQCRCQYNSYWGCSYCYQMGFYIHIIKYPFDPDFLLRSQESHKQDVDDVKERQQNMTHRMNERNKRRTFVRGVKGSSSFMNSNQRVDMVWSFSFEYLHAVLLGSVKHLWEIWTANGFLSKGDVENINKLISCIEMVSEIHRVAREFNFKSKWKASEWRSWLLFFGVPCLRKYLPSECLQHFSLLVNTIFTLLKTKITEEELLQCELDIIEFVGEFENLYGQENMTFNVHLLLHIVECIRRCGPLWATSAFCFESHLHVLKQYALGPKKPEQQMATKSLDILQYKFEVSRTIFHSEIARLYCQRIFSSALLSTYVSESTYGVTFCGNSSPVQITNPVTNEIIAGESFKKCIYKGCVYKSVKNTLSEKRNDTVFKLKSGGVIQVQDIVRLITPAFCQ